MAVQQRPSVGPAAERVLREGRDDPGRGLRGGHHPRRPAVRGHDEQRGPGDAQGYSVAAGCTEAFFIIKPNFTGAGAQFRDDQIRRPPFYQFDMNFAKSTRLAGNVRLQIRFEVYNVFNQTVCDERNYESNPTNAAVRHDRSPGGASVELPALRTDWPQAAVLVRSSSSQGDLLPSQARALSHAPGPCLCALAFFAITLIRCRGCGA